MISLQFGTEFTIIGFAQMFLIQSNFLKMGILVSSGYTPS